MTELQREFELATRAEKRNAELLRQKLLKKVGRSRGVVEGGWLKGDGVWLRAEVDGRSGWAGGAAAPEAAQEGEQAGIMNSEATTARSMPARQAYLLMPVGAGARALQFSPGCS